MQRKKVSLTIGLVFALLTTAVGATVWIHTKLDEKISVSEFERYMELIIDRFDSLEDTIREIRR